MSDLAARTMTVSPFAAALSAAIKHRHDLDKTASVPPLLAERAEADIQAAARELKRACAADAV